MQETQCEELKVKYECKQLKQLEYCGTKCIQYCDEDGGECDNEIVVETTTNFLQCVRLLKKIRQNDINSKIIHKMSQFVSVNYDIFVYNVGEMCEIINICQDDYYEDGYDIPRITTEKYKLFNIDEIEKKNIQKAISNSKQSDKKKLTYTGPSKLNSIGNINYLFIKDLIDTQNYKCYLCDDIILTHSYVPHCCYKFSIDRIIDNLPHDTNNVRMSCYYCNCKNHILYGKTEKVKCDDKDCGCHQI